MLVGAFRVVGWVMAAMTRLAAGLIKGNSIERPGGRMVRRLRWTVVVLLSLLIAWWTLSTGRDMVTGEAGGALVGLIGVYVVVPLLAVALVLAIPRPARRLDVVVRALVEGQTKRRPRLLRRWRAGATEYTSWEMPVGVTVQHLQRWRPALEQGLNCGVELWYRDGVFYVRASHGQLPDAIGFASFYSERRAGKLPFGVGMGRVERVWADLAELPHMLIGGLTGAGKSGFLRQLITWLVLTNPPERLRLGLIDLKGGMELNLFARLPHRLGAVVRDLVGAGELLTWLNAELDRRQAAFDRAGAISLPDWNRRYPGQVLPYLVLVVDETAELTAAESPGREERERRQARIASISRLVRLGRALGIHLILATQRPDAEAVPGALKANLPATLAFRVRDEVNSRILLGEGNTGAASLPTVPGRAIWQWDVETEVQVPWITTAEAAAYLVGLTGTAVGGTEPVIRCPQLPGGVPEGALR